MNIPTIHSGQETPPSPNTSKQFPKALKIVIPIVAAVAIIIACYFLFFNKSEYRAMAEELAPYLPEYTTEEIEAILATEGTAEQNEFAENLTVGFDKEAPEVAEYIEVDEDAGYVSYYGTDGEIYVVTDPDGVSQLSDEELYALMEQEEAFLDQMASGQASEDEINDYLVTHNPDLDDTYLSDYEEPEITPPTDEELNTYFGDSNLEPTPGAPDGVLDGSGTTTPDPSEQVNGTTGVIQGNAG